MTAPTTTNATPERVSDERILDLISGMCKCETCQCLRELIERRKAVSAIEAYDDALGILRAFWAAHRDAASHNTADAFGRAIVQIQHHRDVAGEAT